MKRVTVIVEDELHRKFRVMCALESTEMSEVLRKAIEEFVEKVEKKMKR